MSENTTTIEPYAGGNINASTLFVGVSMLVQKVGSSPSS